MPVAKEDRVIGAKRRSLGRMHVFAHPTYRMPAIAKLARDGGPYTLEGKTDNFNVYYENALGAAGPALANGVLESCEQEYAQLQEWFGGIVPPADGKPEDALPFNVYVVAGNFGAYHQTCAATEMHCAAFEGNNVDLVRMLVVAEEVEVFEAVQGAGWDCGASHGEGLSRVLATEMYPAQLNGFSSAARWLDSPDRPDFINNTEPTDTNYISIGCSVLFLNFLRYQLNYTWKDIIAAGAPALAGTYTKLTGATGGWERFSALLQAKFPIGTPSGVTNDNPFPLSQPSVASGPAALALPVPSPFPGFATADVRALFADVTRMTPRDTMAESAFIAGKMHLARTDPVMHLAARRAMAASLESRLREHLDTRRAGPVPGGVGYGMFYNNPFKTNFATGTAIYWEIVCPNPPGGNVNTFLYLTATNRSAKGVEAFVAYNGQNQTFFKVFDWARPGQEWQTNIPFANLANYLRPESAHGSLYQVLPLMNVTSQSAANYWYNQVWVWNHVANSWDLIYQYGYSATLADQQAGWVGSWGPIVETFQDAYQGTSPMGALATQLISRDGNNQWGAWHFLAPSDGYVRTDNKGFSLLFNDPNYSWAVHS